MKMIAELLSGFFPGVLSGFLSGFLSAAAEALSFLCAAVVFFCGIFLLIVLRGAPFSRPRLFLSALKNDREDGGTAGGPARKGEKDGGAISPVRALLFALGGTLGAGNIVGVSAALIEGGPGALLWMWAAGFAAMPVKYAEVTLALSSRVRGEDGKRHGGAMYYLRPASLRPVFAAICLCSSFSLGNVIQVRAAADAFSILGVPPLLCAALLAAAAFLTLIGGVRAMSSLSAKLIPFLCALYTLACLFVIGSNISALPGVLASVLSGAFSFRAAAGGVGGFALARALRPVGRGVCRGIMSNEAGCGTAPIAHSESAQRSPARQGVLGVIEVFVDTVLLCGLTGLTVLTVFPELPTDISDASALASGAFESVFGSAAGVFLAFALAAFAFATLICWAHYGSEALYYLRNFHKNKISVRGKPDRKRDLLYVFLFCFVSLLGALPLHSVLWSVTDLCVCLMTLINCFGMTAALLTGPGSHRRGRSRRNRGKNPPEKGRIPPSERQAPLSDRSRSRRSGGRPG